MKNSHLYALLNPIFNVVYYMYLTVGMLMILMPELTQRFRPTERMATELQQILQL